MFSSATIFIKCLFASCLLVILWPFCISLLCTHCIVTVKVKMDRQWGGKTVAIQQLHKNKACQTVVYCFMASPEHKFPCTPFFTTHSPPSDLPLFLIFNCLHVSQFSTLVFLFNLTVFVTLPTHLLFEVLSCSCLELLSFFCVPPPQPLVLFLLPVLSLL